MDKYLYDYEVINNKLYLKFASYTETQNLNISIASITDLLNKKINAVNAQVTSNTIVFEGKAAHSAKELMTLIANRNNIVIGSLPDGRKVVLDKLGHLSYQELNSNTSNFAQQSNNIENSIKEIDTLVDKLNTARNSYYNKNYELMTNKEYDELYDKLEILEKQTGYIRSDSPTQNIGANLKTKQASTEKAQTDYSQYKQGMKVNHEDAALSLDKTKNVAVLEIFLNDKDGVLSVKMDGLTVILTYQAGKLVLAATRGNGYTGEVCTINATHMDGIPLTIPYNKTLKIRGEAYIGYKDFNKLNNTLSEEDQYQNPRNLASGTIRSFGKPSIVRERHVCFCAYEIVNWQDLGITTFAQELKLLEQLGFTNVVSHLVANKSNIKEAVETLTSKVKNSDTPADGLVLRLNDLAFGDSLGVATKYPKHSLAFKWEDAEVETQLIDIDWTVGRTGRITPTAVFKSVNLEGSTILRASLHNISMMKQILGKPYVGQKIWVYKSNMIIPQVSNAIKIEDLSNMSSQLVQINIPTACPSCEHTTIIKTDSKSGVDTLWCTNPSCSAKGLQKWTHFIARDAMNVIGLGESILQDLTDLGIINNNLSSLYTATSSDFYRLLNEREGYGEKKINNILDAIEKSKTIALENVLYAYGIPNIGLQTAKQIIKLANNNLDELSAPLMLQKILQTNGLGQVVANSWKQFMMSDKASDFFCLCDILNLKIPTVSTSELNGLTFCCTGDVNIYKNRKELQASIEQRGGKFTSSVTGKTNYLITNDTTSGSAKNKAAEKLGIPIISEEQFISQFGK